MQGCCSRVGAYLAGLLERYWNPTGALLGSFGDQDRNPTEIIVDCYWSIVGVLIGVHMEIHVTYPTRILLDSDYNPIGSPMAAIFVTCWNASGDTYGNPIGIHVCIRLAFVPDSYWNPNGIHIGIVLESLGIPIGITTGTISKPISKFYWDPFVECF